MSGIDELVRERAYELWQQAGRPDGRSDEFWFAAELDFAHLRGVAERLGESFPECGRNFHAIRVEPGH